ncbi:hypothetical protein [Bradyrhizobium pachyrhizi]|uniref:hypothetical protein n=1 Tax=Bradyrhizobium pachyrhizi TaxID=280333 RepID=UPI0012E36CE3|nr:hypothetical protein [Bradyrhizobium pachyrhizi]
MLLAGFSVVEWFDASDDWSQIPMLMGFFGVIVLAVKLIPHVAVRVLPDDAEAPSRSRRGPSAWKWLLGIYLLAVAGVALYHFGELKDAFIKPIRELKNSQCEARWEHSGMPARYSDGVGCMVNVDGRWLPESNVQVSPTSNH